MDKLDKCYVWHIVTLAKMKLKSKKLSKINELVCDCKSIN